jgi:nicotinate-nucleotide adenylyltransferase
MELAGLIIVNREGWPVWPPQQLREALGLPGQIQIRQEIVEMPAVSVSSSDLRLRAASRRSLRYLVPRAVECYIETHHLYGPAST